MQCGASTLSLKKHGAHVCSWQSEGEEDVMFMSDLAKFGPADAIRGGIPLCFPQFGLRGALPQHGFFRKSNDWVASDPRSLPNGDVEVTLKHTDTVIIHTPNPLIPAPVSSLLHMRADTADPQAETRASAWPHPFEASYIVTLSNASVKMKLHVKNTGATDLTFTCALHTYFNVADIAETAVRGLQGVDYEDGVDGGKVKTEEAPAITFTAEVDRVYGPAPNTLLVEDSRRVVEISKDDGFPDAVVWNPWVDKAAALADLPDDAYKRFVCVEVGVICSPVTVPAGGEWSGSQTLCVRRE